MNSFQRITGYRGLLLSLSHVAFCVIPMISSTASLALPIPWAETNSALTVSVGLHNASLIPNQSTAGWSDSQTETAVLALGMTGLPAGHIASAEASAVIREAAAPSGRVTSESQQTLYEIGLNHRTRAESFAIGPLAGQATAQSRAGLNSLEVEPVTGADVGASLLRLDWDVGTWETLTTPSASFSLIRHAAKVVRTLPGTNTDETIENTVGFVTIAEDGRTKLAAFEAQGASAAWYWTETAGTLSEKTHSFDSPDSLRVDIPLGGDRQLVDITVSHFEYSAEAPLAAVPRVAEQVGSIQQSRNEITQPDFEQLAAKMRWDPADGTLTFDPLPINLLSDNAVQHVAKRYRDDPLAGGSLEIDPLHYLEMPDGDGYFVGDEVRLVDRHGTVLFAASLPGLVYDHNEALFAVDGFNMFAPLLHTEGSSDTDSPWLRRFNDRLHAEPLFLPELFLGFANQDIGSDPWNSPFEAIPNAVVSFAGVAVPLPGTVALVVFGLIVLAMRRGTSWYSDGGCCRSQVARTLL